MCINSDKCVLFCDESTDQRQIEKASDCNRTRPQSPSSISSVTTLPASLLVLAHHAH